jgi:hypothetical protein
VKRRPRVLVHPYEKAKKAALKYVFECSAGMNCVECSARRADFIAGWLARNKSARA